MKLKTWTVTAIDQFERVFGYTQVELPMWNGFDSYMSDASVARFAMEKATREILREMGNAAWAEWVCRVDEMEWGDG